ncbi:uncharacterized protein CTRU02_209604 [Colletotrichum truncatum]|uniref:Uncharacterized protein n=1 Tax=Colletotrichum truncatum TaxID=5467 RepID=A0ACC3YSU8_COLTU
MPSSPCLRSYTAIDDIPSHINPFLYKQLEDWGFDGFAETVTGYQVEETPADAIKQWLNLGGSVFLYDFDPDTIINAIVELVDNGSVALKTLQKRVRKVLEAKYNIGLFHNPFLAEDTDHTAITESHIPLALEVAHNEQNIKKVALVGPFADTFNFGTYSGTWGAAPADRANTIRQGILKYADELNLELTTVWGANSWNYNAQYPIPGYLLSYNDTPGTLQATYYSDTEFKDQVYQKREMPNRDWGLYPPHGLPSNSFSTVWEGDLAVPVSVDTDGYIGVAVAGTTSVRLFIDGELVAESGVSESPTILGEVLPYTYTTSPKAKACPPGGAKFVFRPNSRHHLRIEYQTWVHEARKKAAGVYSRVQLWWNLVDQKDAVAQAKQVSSDADLVILAVGAAWNSDAENGDRATLSLPKDQENLVHEVFATGKPVVLVIEGGRPFAIPDFYAKSAAVLSTGYLGQAAGQAIADVLFGKYNPGGRLTMSIPYDVGAIPAFYNQRITKDPLHIPHHIDIPKPVSIYLLRRNNSSVVMANKQLVAFGRFYVESGKTVDATLELDVDRYLPTINRQYERELERGEYRFVLAEDGSLDAQVYGEAALRVVGSHKY